MERLHNPIRPYAWGSHTVIARTQGRPAPTAEPEAELWVGAHPSAPSLVDGAGLDERIAADPDALLGSAVAAEFGPRLPYLMKLLAAERPLSMQVHPDAARARAGFDAEERAGRPRTGGERNYVDPHHKPELLVAVDRFEALCGFRDPLVSADLLAALDLPALAPLVAALRRPDPAGALRAAVTWSLAHTGSAARRLIERVARAEPSGLVVELAARYPDDPGVLLALLLNYVVLRPGQGIWMPAGNLHCYLSGTGVEIMAASDNVLRAGLTGKRVDVAELLAVVRYDVLTDPVRPPVTVRPGVTTWPVPVREFALHRLRPAEAGGRVELVATGPRALLCLAGEARVADDAGAVRLVAGAGAFGAAGAGPLVVSGDAEVYLATVGA